MSRWSFVQHPASLGESYLEHISTATHFGTQMIAAGCACIVHGLFPFVFTTTGSRTVAKLHLRMAERAAARLPLETPVAQH